MHMWGIILVHRFDSLALELVKYRPSVLDLKLGNYIDS